MREKLDRRDITGMVAAGAALIGVVGLAFSKEVTDVFDKGVEAVDSLRENPTSETTPPACTEIGTIDQAAKIGTLVLVMAEQSEITLLQNTMITNKISNFTFTGNLTDTTAEGIPIATATNGLIDAVESTVQIGVTFALDEEGGKVQRTEELTGFGPLPSAAEQAAMGAQQITPLFGTHAEKLETLGVTLDFAPVADADARGAIAELGRAYGTDIESVVASAGAVISGLHAQGLEATLKHFPGLVDASDTHIGTGETPDLATMQQTSLPIFQRLINEYDPGFVMVSHASTLGLTNGPASLDPATYNLLKNDLGFSGVAITDALNMEALNAPGDLLGQASDAVTAIQAGADMVIIDLQAAEDTVHTITSAVAAGVIPQARLDDASKRVLSEKGYSIC